MGGPVLRAQQGPGKIGPGYSGASPASASAPPKTLALALIKLLASNLVQDSAYHQAAQVPCRWVRCGSAGELPFRTGPPTRELPGYAGCSFALWTKCEGTPAGR